MRQLDEPDRGTTHYVNDGFGDVLSSMDANGRVITFGVDTLGRVETRKDTLGAKVSTTTWTWDTAPHGIGRLQSVVSPDGVKTYSYTKRGQIETVTLGVGNESFTARIAYDDIGRVKTLDYPHLTLPPLSNSASLRGEGSRKKSIASFRAPLSTQRPRREVGEGRGGEVRKRLSDE